MCDPKSVSLKNRAWQRPSQRTRSVVAECHSREFFSIFQGLNQMTFPIKDCMAPSLQSYLAGIAYLSLPPAGEFLISVYKKGIQVLDLRKMSVYLPRMSQLYTYSSQPLFSASWGAQQELSSPTPKATSTFQCISFLS